MWAKVCLFCGLAALPVLAAMSLPVDQLVTFVKSSVQMKHPDKQVAVYLKQIKLTEQLDERTIEELQGLGAGPKTVEALRELREQSLNLPKPKPAPGKVVVAPLAGPDSLEQGKILDEVREYALTYVKSLPNFLCLQVTRRFYDNSGMEFWRAADTVVAKLSYFDQQEDYKVIRVNDRIVDTTMDRVGGSISTGDFGTWLREIFEPSSQTQFDWERWATLRGRRAYVFSYRVAQQNSKWHVTYNREQDVVPAYRGLLYVDKDTSAILRLTMKAENLPPGFPVSAASETLDYDFVSISGQEHLLPLRAQVQMRQGKLMTKNEIEYRLYRKFGASADITFGSEAIEPLPAEKTQEQPPK